MFATSIVAAFRVTQSIPQRIEDVLPVPRDDSTRIDQSLAPGATPTVPKPLSRAPTMPATMVPCPTRSVEVSPLTQSTPPTTFRSGWFAWMPVSRMATSTSTRSSNPSIFAVGDRSAPTLRRPGETVCGVASTAVANVRIVPSTERAAVYLRVASGRTPTTSGSARSRAWVAGSMSAANPESAAV